jgi:hypothetical protein
MNPVPNVPIPDIIRAAVNILDDTLGETGRVHWRQEICLDRLKMTDPCRCIGGQLFGYFNKIKEENGGPIPRGHIGALQGLCAIGFNGDLDNGDDHYERIQSAWDLYLADCDEEMARLRGVTLDEITQALAPPPKDVKIYPGEDPYDVAGVVLPPDPE